MEDVKERLEKLKLYLNVIQDILTTNTNWNKIQQSIAKYTFMNTLMLTTNEIVFQVASQFNRDIVIELKNAISLLEDKLNKKEDEN